jgi:hypothetical protein
LISYGGNFDASLFSALLLADGDVSGLVVFELLPEHPVSIKPNTRKAEITIHPNLLNLSIIKPP